MDVPGLLYYFAQGACTWTFCYHIYINMGASHGHLSLKCHFDEQKGRKPYFTRPQQHMP
jgi:hypothetical protein